MFLKAGLAGVALVVAVAAGFALSMCLQRRRRGRRVGPDNQPGPESGLGGFAISNDPTSHSNLVQPDYVPLVVNDDQDEDEVELHEQSRQPLAGANTHATDELKAWKQEPPASNADPPVDAVGPLVSLGALEALR